MAERTYCVFCEILAGRAEASFVYQGDRVAAFMTLGAVNPGHVLVVPRQHAPALADVDPSVACTMFDLGMQLAAAIRRSSLRCEGINLLINDGRPAFQSIFHTHLHVIPRFRGDGFGLIMPPRFTPFAPRPELDDAAARIREALDAAPAD